MKKINNIGVWMDHATANLMKFNAELIQSNIIHSKFTHQVKVDSLNKGENLMHNKEQQEQAAYYKELAEILKNYNQILLFGPTRAKLELYNILKEDRHFDRIKIDIQSADKMTENQQHRFVIDFFQTN